jgi:hypothetical protein
MNHQSEICEAGWVQVSVREKRGKDSIRHREHVCGRVTMLSAAAKLRMRRENEGARERVR